MHYRQFDKWKLIDEPSAAFQRTFGIHILEYTKPIQCRTYWVQLIRNTEFARSILWWITVKGLCEAALKSSHRGNFSTTQKVTGSFIEMYHIYCTQHQPILGENAPKNSCITRMLLAWFFHFQVTVQHCVRIIKWNSVTIGLICIWQKTARQTGTVCMKQKCWHRLSTKCHKINITMLY